MNETFCKEYDEDYDDFKNREEKYSNYSATELEAEFEAFKKNFLEEHKKK